MPAQEKLSPTEQILAYLGGLGILLTIVGLFLLAIGTVQDDIATSLLIVGVALIVLAAAAWLIRVQPWRRFDDLKTPYYTVHEEAHGEPVIVAAAASVTVDEIAPGVVVEQVTVTTVEQVEPPEAAEPAAQPPALRGETAVEMAPAWETPPPAPVEAQPPAMLDAEPAPLSEVEEDVVAAAEAGSTGAAIDNLMLIDGIGPRSQEALIANGVTTFAQIAAMSPAELERALHQQNVRVVASTATWPLQAELAARQEWTALSALQERIRGGVLHDELTAIAGVGFQAQAALWDAGYRTFADVATASPDDLQAALLRAGVPVADTTTWPAQAKDRLADIQS